MGPYHIVLTHFPIALWTLAMAVILLRVLSAGPLARRLDQALVPLLTVALLFGLAAYATGTQVWDWESISASPLGRNHLMLAAWTVALWAVVWWLRWRRGEAVWEGGMRWAMAALALLGAVLLAITGTLGGHLMSAPTDLSKLLRHLGWGAGRGAEPVGSRQAGGGFGDRLTADRQRAAASPLACPYTPPISFCTRSAAVLAPYLRISRAR